MDEEAQKILNAFSAVGVQMPHAEPVKEESPDRKTLTEKLIEAGIPKRYMGASFEALTRDGCPPEVREMAAEAYKYAKHVKENAKAGRGLLFFGEVGRMKTTLAACVARAALEQGVSVYFISMPELLDTMISMSKSRDGSELHRFEEKIKHVTLLILDDFGAEYPRDWVLNKVDAIITRRYNDMKPVILTTNMLPNEIKERYVQRVYDRLRSTSKVLGTYGDSLRKTAE